MRRSDERILVTHVGSLPRGHALNELLIRSEQGEGVDRGELEAAIERRVAHVYRQQLDAGIDIANDGEQGRVGFQTYVADR
ncbi:MAG TPA: epoxyalkane--coenzyme M transferase, partial [Xanthobacteraceae bacterium]|nr:epoxyalkane--coenzyme M transferase [Xanthobacteraceae bacterium]